MPISAGVEKFYTFYQYLSVLSLCISLLGINLISIYLLARTPFIRVKRSFTILAICFSCFLFTELALQVVPNKSSVLLWLAFNCLMIFLCGRVFYLFTVSILEKSHSIVHPVLIAETALFLTVFLTEYMGSPLVKPRFFLEIGFGYLVPGPLFFILLSSSSFWVILGLRSLMTASVWGTKRKARGYFALSIAIILCSFLMHHLLPGNRYLPLFPLALPIAVVFISLSLVKHKLLGALPIPLEQVMEQLDMLILVFGEAGNLVSRNCTRFHSIDLTGIDTEADFSRYLADLLGEETENKTLQRLLEHRNLSKGKLKIAENDGFRYMEYRIVPVMYLRHHVGKLICLMDITEDELGILELEAVEGQLRGAYEELRMYSKTTLYRDAELDRDRLLQRVTRELETALTRIAEDVDKAIKKGAQRDSIEVCIGRAEGSLEQIRTTVRTLKHPDKELS